MDRLVRFAIALSLLLALAVGAVSQDESRHEQDSGVPQVQLEYVDDYESTRPSTHYAYDAMEGDMLNGMGATRYGSTGTGPDEEHTEDIYEQQDYNMDEEEQAVEPEQEERYIEPESDEPDKSVDEPVVSIMDVSVEEENMEPIDEPVETRYQDTRQVPPETVEEEPVLQSSTPAATSDEDSSEDSSAARQAALARRAAEEAEVKAAEAAEKSRRDTGAPVEKEAPKSIFDYYKPPVLEPVYVGGYYKRANPWDKGKRDD